MLIPILFLLAQQPTAPTPADVPPAAESATQPSLVGTPNTRVTLGADDQGAPKPIGRERSIAGVVTRWEEGRLLAIRDDAGQDQTFPIAATLLYPPDLAVGRRVRVSWQATNQGVHTSRIEMADDGRAATTASHTRTAPVIAGSSTPNVSGGSVTLTGRAKVVPAPAGTAPATKANLITGTVVGYEQGKSVTLEVVKGALVTFDLTEKTPVPRTLAIGQKAQVSVKNRDGKNVVLRVRPAV